MNKKEAVVEQTDVVVTQETPEQMLAAQKDGFTEANTSTAVNSATDKAAEQIQTDAEAVAKAEAEKAAADAVAAEASKQKAVELTAAEVEELRKKAGQFDSLKSTLDKVNGKFGSMEAQLKKLLESKPANVALTEEDVAELAQEYGPELSKALLKTLNKFGAKLGAAPAADKAAVVVDEKANIEAAVTAVKNEFDAKLTETKQATELRMLNLRHGDWKAVVRAVDAQGKDAGLKPEFQAWVGTLPQADQTKLLETWDADFLSDKIGEYKKHLSTVAKAQEEAKNKKPTVPKVLSNAVVQKSLPGTISTKSALDEQREGYGTA